MAHLILPFTTIVLLICSIMPMIMCTTATNKGSNDLVLDVEGNPLEVGSSYYVRTVLSQLGIGGGLIVASKPNHPQCPQYVAQLALGFDGESPITFIPSDPSQKYIHVSEDLSIAFNTTSSPCSQGVWQLSPDSNSGNVYLSTGGAIGYPTSQTTSTLLRVDRSSLDGYSSYYELGYCPSSSTTADASARPDIVCGVIDAIPDDSDVYKVWLGLSPDRIPNFFHLLSFIKA